MKTKASNRNISIDSKDIQVLQKQKKLIAAERLASDGKYTHLNLVCPTSTDAPFMDGNVRKIFNRLTKQSELKRIRFHDLRHTHVSLLLYQGVNPKIIAERLGHSNLRTTLDVYGHIMPNLQKYTAKLFGDMLFGANRE